uniref:Uncharacterized protein n=1 Tax=Leersia perrieri TaxID=77586 RepID=A0A0D9XY07_9ORYZ
MMKEEEQDLREGVQSEREKMNFELDLLLKECSNLAKDYHELQKDLKLHDVLALMQLLPAIRQELGWTRLYINNGEDQDNTQLLQEQWNPQSAISPPTHDFQHTIFLTYLPRGPGNQQKVQRESFNNHKWELKDKIKSKSISHVDIRKLLYTRKNSRDAKSQKDDGGATFKLNMIEISLNDTSFQYMNAPPCVALCLVYQINKSPMLYLIESLVYRQT